MVHFGTRYGCSTCRCVVVSIAFIASHLPLAPFALSSSPSLSLLALPSSLLLSRWYANLRTSQLTPRASQNNFQPTMQRWKPVNEVDFALPKPPVTLSYPLAFVFAPLVSSRSLHAPSRLKTGIPYQRFSSVPFFFISLYLFKYTE
ncbi:hypothetical protein D9613_012125 [Agrocybe pediades]|uniref:Uncharacterized protein n=1 Tax=Agrocybe pediades TaxID=84607 RepID=A0A8H4R3W0_9AGAR|nr:hypothetical protein D9613_012125 [Agrocybe pediades]